MRLLSRLVEMHDARGWLSDDDLRKLAASAGVPLYRVEGLASFYTRFRRTPPPRHEIHVCRDVSCWLNGGDRLAAEIARRYGGEAAVEVSQVSCIGRCDKAPAATLNHHPLPAAALLACQHLEDAAVAPQASPMLDGLDGPGLCRADPYARVSCERYRAIRQALAQGQATGAKHGGIDPAIGDRIIAELQEAGLRGMGGAGFPAGKKWDLVRRQPATPKFVICNADESEPGTFKDRMILSELPHLVVEGMLLAAVAVGAHHGIIFLRHHYEPELHALRRAIADARQAGLVGTNLLGSGFDFEIEVFVSPGGYILGEETALLEALEDRRGEPRNKPPFPGTHGLHGRPTLINNVETLAFVPAIVLGGADWWKSQGRPGFSGLKFMSVSGHAARPGVYEVQMGTPAAELLERAGGVKDGRPLLAFAPGGASSPFLPAARLDVPLDFDVLAKAGSMLGSGALIVAAEGTDLTALAANLTAFFRNESCGKCVPCRIGTERAVELLEGHRQGRVGRQDLELLRDLNETLVQTSICGLGQAALGPALSLLQIGGLGSAIGPPPGATEVSPLKTPPASAGDSPLPPASGHAAAEKSG